MRMKQMHRRILEGCLACLLCFTGSIPAFAAETATPANADERRENPPGLESEACILPVWLYGYLCLCAAVLLFQPPDETEKYIPVRTDLPCHVRPVILSCTSYAGCGSRIPLVHD